VPAVVVGFEEPPVVVAPDAVVVEPPDVVDALDRELFIPFSMRALFNVKVPSLPRARHPVTVTSCSLSPRVALWLVVLLLPVVVCGAVVVVLCAASETANPSAAAMPSPVAVRVIGPPQ
jgi:hypothetical protein